MTAGNGDRRVAAADAAGRILRLVDRLCAIGYLGFSLWVISDLWRSATEHGWALLVLAVPVIVSTVLLAPSVFGRADRLLRPWTPRGRRLYTER